jgi:hypothetical protein
VIIVHWYDPNQPLDSWSSVYYPAQLTKKPPKAVSSTRQVTLVGDHTPRIVPAQVSMFSHTFPGCIAVYSILIIIPSNDHYDALPLWL